MKVRSENPNMIALASKIVVVQDQDDASHPQFLL